MARETTGPAMEVSCREVKERLDAGADFVLLDCREPDEYALVHIEAARHIPMSQLQARVDELSEFKQSSLVVHCHHGVRSLQVAHWLRRLGFSQVQSMSGGIDEWSEVIDPRLPRY